MFQLLGYKTFATVLGINITPLEYQGLLDLNEIYEVMLAGIMSMQTGNKAMGTTISVVQRLGTICHELGTKACKDKFIKWFGPMEKTDHGYKFSPSEMHSYSGDYHKTVLFSNPDQNQGYYTPEALEKICNHVQAELTKYKTNLQPVVEPEHTPSDTDFFGNAIEQPITPVSGIRNLLTFTPQIRADPLRNFSDEDLELLRTEANGVPAATAQLEGDFSGGEFLTAGRASTMDWRMLDGLMFIRNYKKKQAYVEQTIRGVMEAEKDIEIVEKKWKCLFE